MGTLLHDPRTSRWLRIAFIVVVLAIAFWLPTYFDQFRVFQLTRMIYLGITLLGLNLLVGYTGLISLGHIAFVAVGAYTSAILLTDAPGVPYLLHLPIAAAITFLFGYVLGFPALRLQGLYLALLTLAIAIATPPLLKRFDSVTGGSMGLGVSRPAAPEWTGLADDQYLYYIVLLTAILLAVLAWNLLRSRVGRAMIAIRENEIAAESMGVHLQTVKTITFGWSAMYAGISGVFATWLVEFVSPDSFTIVQSIEFLAGVVVGGLASLTGGFIGGAFLVFIPNFANELSSNQGTPGIIFGAIIVLTMYIAPTGLVGLFRRGWGALLRRTAPEDAGPGAAGDQPEPLEEDAEADGAVTVGGSSDEAASGARTSGEGRGAL